MFNKEQISSYNSKDKQPMHKREVLTIYQIISFIIALIGLFSTIFIFFSLDTYLYFKRKVFLFLVLLMYCLIVGIYFSKIIKHISINVYYASTNKFRLFKYNLKSYISKKLKERKSIRKEKYDDKTINEALDTKVFRLNGFNSNVINDNSQNKKSYIHNSAPQKSYSLENNINNISITNNTIFNSSKKKTTNNTYYNNSNKNIYSSLHKNKGIEEITNKILTNSNSFNIINNNVMNDANNDGIIQNTNFMSNYLKSIFNNQNTKVQDSNLISNSVFNKPALNTLNLNKEKNHFEFNQNIGNSKYNNIKQTPNNANNANNANNDTIKTNLNQENIINKYFLQSLKALYSNPNYSTDLSNIEDIIKIDSKNLSNLPKILYELGFKYELNHCVGKLKNFTYSQVLQKLIDYHDCNFCNINELLKSYNIELTDNLDLSFQYMSKIDELINERMSSSNIFHNYNSNNNMFKAFNTDDRNSTLNFNKICIFWGDLQSIVFLIEKINERLKNLRIMNNIHNNSSSNSDRTGSSGFNFNNINEVKSIYYDNNNNLINASDSTSNSLKINFITSNQYPTTLLKNKQNEETLVKVIFELKNRINLNSQIFPEQSAIKVNTREDYLILMDYCIVRVKELLRKFDDFDAKKGGMYKKKTWITFFPSDSVLIGNILIKQFADSIVDDKNLTKCLMISYPTQPLDLNFESKFGKEENSFMRNRVYIYYASPENYESYFNLVYKNKLICFNKGQDNFFECFVLLLFFMKFKISLEKYGLQELYCEVFDN